MLGIIGGTLGLTTIWLFTGWLGQHDLLGAVKSHLGEVKLHLAREHQFPIPDVASLLHQYEAQLRLDAAMLLGGLLAALALIGLAIQSLLHGIEDALVLLSTRTRPRTRRALALECASLAPRRVVHVDFHFVFDGRSK